MNVGQVILRSGVDDGDEAVEVVVRDRVHAREAPAIAFVGVLPAGVQGLDADGTRSRGGGPRGDPRQDAAEVEASDER